MVGDSEELWSSFLQGAGPSAPEWDWGPSHPGGVRHHLRRVQLLTTSRSARRREAPARRRPSLGVVAVAVVFVLGAGTTAAIAATTKASGPPAAGKTGARLGGPADPRLSCDPSGVALGQVCRLVFHGLKGGDGAGHHVCFSTTASNAVLGTSGHCSITDGRGQARAVFIAESAGTATVTATETSPSGAAEEAGRITVNVGG